ncbi:cyclic GMP-AMP synthase-like [Rana temporaria]|uniref:cyclic GMP-AMP synthase-like n=1 Tax=Rana temporaria TaxID=8407 RepID=UPI001AAC63F8|nr:cyclic GMP-AMP synthase-like [Rana temporaria]
MATRPKKRGGNSTDEIRRQASRRDSLPNSNLSKHLKNAVESLRMKMGDISKAAEKVNKIIELIIKSESTKSHPLFKSMKKMSTGSYYEGLKNCIGCKDAEEQSTVGALGSPIYRRSGVPGDETAFLSLDGTKHLCRGLLGYVK